MLEKEKKEISMGRYVLNPLLLVPSSSSSSFLDRGSSSERLFGQGVPSGECWGTPSFQTPLRVIVPNGIRKET